jgi:HNH endonuclease
MVGEPGELAGYGPVTTHIARQTAAQLAQVGTFRFAVSDHDGTLLTEGVIPTDLLPDMDLELRRRAADATAGPDGRAHRRPTAAQIAFVRARDRHCQAPGCRVPAHRCEIDHRIPWQHRGPTLIDNLYCLCKRHHRAKDEAGYLYHPGPDGIAWSTPYGHHYTKQRTDRLRPDDEHRRRRSHHSLGIIITVDTDRLHNRPQPTPRQ